MNLDEMLKQAQKLQEDMENAQKRLETEEIEVSAAGGTVKFTITGSSEFKSVSLSDELIGDKDALESAILAGVQEAIKEARALHEDLMKDITSGLELPGMDDLGKMQGAPKRRTDLPTDEPGGSIKI